MPLEASEEDTPETPESWLACVSRTRHVVLLRRRGGMTTYLSRDW